MQLLDNWLTVWKKSYSARLMEIATALSFLPVPWWVPVIPLALAYALRFVAQKGLSLPDDDEALA